MRGGICCCFLHHSAGERGTPATAGQSTNEDERQHSRANGDTLCPQTAVELDWEPGNLEPCRVDKSDRCVWSDISRRSGFGKAAHLAENKTSAPPHQFGTSCPKLF